jgi:hypothetical protein
MADVSAASTLTSDAVCGTSTIASNSLAPRHALLRGYRGWQVSVVHKLLPRRQQALVMPVLEEIQRDDEEQTGLCLRYLKPEMAIRSSSYGIPNLPWNGHCTNRFCDASLVARLRDHDRPAYRVWRA